MEKDTYQSFIADPDVDTAEYCTLKPQQSVL